MVEGSDSPDCRIFGSLRPVKIVRIQGAMPAHQSAIQARTQTAPDIVRDAGRSLPQIGLRCSGTAPLESVPAKPYNQPVANLMAQGTPMAEDEETATARYIAGNISTQLMLKTLFEPRS
jgi:hypothetical protein